jgi:hypothetical protein
VHAAGQLLEREALKSEGLIGTAKVFRFNLEILFVFETVRENFGFDKTCVFIEEFWIHDAAALLFDERLARFK